MKILKIVSAILLALAIIAAFVIVMAPIALAQTTTHRPAPPIGTAQIPFDFWIGDTKLAAGEYALYSEQQLNTLVLLRNTKTKVEEQAFLLPTGDPVASADYKLVFIVHKGQRYLQELWESNGRAVVTSQFGICIGPADTRSEVPLTKNASKAAAAA